VVGWVITDSEASVYVPVRHSGGGNIPDTSVGEFERKLNMAFKERARKGYWTVGHNLGFDLRMAAKHNVFPTYPLEDTMINQGLISDITRGYGLDDCCNHMHVIPKLGADLYRAIASKFGGLPDRKQMANYHKMPGDHHFVVDYATGDGISTLVLRNAQQKYLDDEQLRKPWKLECQLIHRVARIHTRGLRIDSDYANDLVGPNGTIQSKIEAAQRNFAPGFNTNSPKDVEALYRSNGFGDGDFSRTKTGAVSFAEAWLSGNDIGRAILAVRHLKKARDSFVAPLIGERNVYGRVHPILNQSKSDEYGVIGARFSCSEPNLQAFPKRNKPIGRLVRRLVIADSGYEIQEGDAKQQEPRLFAYFSDDEWLGHGYRTGTFDLHDATSEGLNLDRDTAKRMGMGLLTGMSVPTLANHMKMTESEAQNYHNLFFKRFPKIKVFHKEAKAIFVSSGYVRSILGRRARLDEVRYCYRAMSRIIQNSGGDHIKTCLLRACEFEEANPRVQILLTIHDSVMWQRQIGFDTSELVRLMENVVNEPDFNLGIPIPFEVGTGPDWATASYGK
jgi:DNA polymerase-1